MRAVVLENPTHRVHVYLARLMTGGAAGDGAHSHVKDLIPTTMNNLP